MNVSVLPNLHFKYWMFLRLSTLQWSRG